LEASGYESHDDDDVNSAGEDDLYQPKRVKFVMRFIIATAAPILFLLSGIYIYNFY
jgi:hypothetical protein